VFCLLERGNCLIGVLVVLAFVVLILASPGLFLSFAQTPVAGFHPDLYGDADVDEIYSHRKLYEQAAEFVNRDLMELAANYGLGWGVLAALDLVAYDNEIKGPEYAELLRPYAEYMEAACVTTYWKRSESSLSGSAGEMQNDGGGEEFDLNDFYVVDTATKTEQLVTRVDTYSGVFVFKYEQTEESVITGYSPEGEVTDVKVVKKHALRNVVYEADWSRLREALRRRWDVSDVDSISDDDVIFVNEWAMQLQAGIMEFVTLEAATSLDLYRGGAVLVYISEDGYVWPVEGCYTLTSVFGEYRDIPSIGVRGIHKGIDIPAPVGTNVLAVTAGVVGAIYETAGGGRQLRLDGYDGRSYYYLHLAHWASSYVGMPVEAGQVIAASGNTGKFTTGPHLHFEVHVNGVPVDPLVACGWLDMRELVGR